MAPLVWVVHLCLTAAAGAQEPRITIDTVRVASGRLVVDFHVDSLLTSRLLAGMQRGLTSAARFRVQLWRKSGWFFNALVAEREFQVKSAFAPWEGKYLLQSATERRLTKALAVVRAGWEEHRGLVLADSAQLRREAPHYLVIEIVCEPVSRESLQEIRGWLAGEFKGLQPDTTAAAAAPRGGWRFRLLDTVVDLTGFGARVTSMKSRSFWVAENNRIIFTE
ncbi:MAG: DUF4390 domain-containing protein [candidate division KSB1 bacterium]|nr:DUF4390 domain-containing protein [candidate division KSB1 bacterium]MDZ7275849.1 DUF4390 domain-containing protein [candidate division KSB1 bacterium]MDZ7287599.1 DUF4390 domain-containing protein [candidate division KSB1 bacterium]MDZ7306497.1 DUF4390 domain-containing protein [candidate division KSB1 bacterium]MDZ7350577.1 DUF4390 domain-containing protein [candidate division KSB1 bacterium]